MDKVAEQAARWFLRLQEDSAISQTFTEWQQWLNAEREHRIQYEAIESTVLQLTRTGARPALPSAAEMARDSYDGSQSIAEWKKHKNANKESRLSWQRYAMAAGVAFLILGGAWFWAQRTQVSELGSYSYETTPGRQRVASLPDGSTVTLDADSSLQVHFSAGQRLLTLSRGEAYFQVAKDFRRPFVVRAGSARVTALGTAFNVRLSDDRTIVSVTEGKVEFVATSPERTASQGSQTRPKLAAHLSAGESVSYVDDGNLQALPALEAPLAIGWLNGRRQYRNEPLRYVIADVDRYTGRKIELADEETGELRFTGSLNLENSEAWLRGLSVALPVVIKERGDGALSVALAALQ